MQHIKKKERQVAKKWYFNLLQLFFFLRSAWRAKESLFAVMQYQNPLSAFLKLPWTTLKAKKNWLLAVASREWVRRLADEFLDSLIVNLYCTIDL